MILQNDHNVYILGAGFSCDGGLPVLRNFLTVMRDAHPALERTPGREPEAESIRKVLEFRLKATSAGYWTPIDLENIEELFSLASADRANSSLADHIKRAIAATLDFAKVSGDRARTRLNLEGDPGLPFLQRHPAWIKSPSTPDPNAQFFANNYTYYAARLLGLFKNWKPKGTNTFVTLNYDTLLEDGLAELGVPFSYALSPDKVDYGESAKASTAEDQLLVLKLHGSVNWTTQPPKGVGKPRLRVVGSYDDLRNQSSIPEIVPPTWRKVFSSDLADVWDAAVERIQTATRIIVIGFSMPDTDTHFKFLLSAGLRENISLREIVFVNPDEALLKARAESVFRQEHLRQRRIQFFPHYLRSFLGENDQTAQFGRPLHERVHLRLR